MFLTIDELNTVATREVIDLITNNDDAIVEEIIAESIDLMRSYLFKHYNTEAIFSKEGNERSRILLKYLKDIVIHEVYIRRTKKLNEVAKIRYDEAMLWLEKIAKGDIEADLPKRLTDLDGDDKADESVPFMKLGSRKTYKNHF
ncbi:phage protein Gp36 family protein [Capnocytophaga canimorsus]|uniref:phage protein Gp36 family protein n=1 Tax=Capnocytophaga canimorsus TaxID=28188 RepID=UPI0037D8340D